MWTLYYKATKYNKPPSEYFADLVDEWTRYQFDNAVTYFGTVIENALAETKEVGAGKDKQRVPVYEGGLEQLLDDDFRLPRPPTKLEKRRQGAANLLALAADPRSGIKMWRELPKATVEQNGAG